jgi:hypothetical protein
MTATQRIAKSIAASPRCQITLSTVCTFSRECRTLRVAWSGDTRPAIFANHAVISRSPRDTDLNAVAVVRKGGTNTLLFTSVVVTSIRLKCCSCRCVAGIKFSKIIARSCLELP